ncbi:unnamed protein product, partial [Sphacelaria rigidula]
MNDRSIIQHDAAIKEMQTSEVYTEKVYPLLVEHGVPVERKGNYSVVDNGNNKVNSYLWSEALESVRKDVECFFGILKRRFRTLKLGIIFQDEDDIDNMFFTCCILH